MKKQIQSWFLLLKLSQLSYFHPSSARTLKWVLSRREAAAVMSLRKQLQNPGPKLFAFYEYTIDLNYT